MKLNTLKLNSIEDIKTQFKVQNLREVYDTSMDTLVMQTIQWAIMNSADCKFVKDNCGIIFKIQHGMLKPGWQDLPMSERLRDEVYPQYCELWFINCNDALLVLGTGFTDPHRNLKWQLGPISGQTVIKLLLI